MFNDRVGSVFLLLLGLMSVAWASPQFEPNVQRLKQMKNKIARIMIACGEIPESCVCENGRELVGNRFFQEVFLCNPKSCLCPDGNVVEDLPQKGGQKKFQTLLSIGNFMKHWGDNLREIDQMCEGERPKGCDCKNGEDIEFPRHRDFIKISECQPEACECPDGKKINVTAFLSNAFVRQLTDFCDIRECDCDIGSKNKLYPPFYDIEAIENCKPNQCFCTDGSSISIPSVIAIERGIINAMKTFMKREVQRVSKLCEGGESPSSCDCRMKRGSVTQFKDLRELQKCFPKTCVCGNEVIPLPSIQKYMKGFVRDLKTELGRRDFALMTEFFKNNKIFGGGRGEGPSPFQGGPPPFLNGPPRFLNFGSGSPEGNNEDALRKLQELF